MINIFKNLLLVLNQNQKKKLYSLQGLIFLSTIIEIFSVAIIAPFMAIVGNVGIIYSNGIIKSLYISSGASSAQHFLILSGIFVLIILFTSACLSIITIRQLSIFAADIGAEFGNRLYQYYIKKNYIFHASGNSAELLKKISTEISRITDNILQPFVQINARVGTVLLVIIFVFIYNPYVAIVIFTLLVSVYYIIYRVVKWRLAENGLKISEYSEKRLKLMVEGFSSIKELHLLKKTDFYINKFEESGKVFAKSYGSSNSIYNSPRYIVEFIVYGVMIGLVVTLLSAYNGDVSKVLPVMSVFGVAAIKMLPSFQQIYSGVAQIKGPAIRHGEVGAHVGAEVHVAVRDLALEPAMHRVVTQHVGQVVRFEQVVDADDFDVVEILHRGAQHVASDASEAVDANLDRHCEDSCCRVGGDWDGGPSF